MVTYFLSFYAYLLVLFIIGYLPARFLWDFGDKDRQMVVPTGLPVVLTAFPVGFLLLHLSVFAASRLLETGTRPVAWPVLLAWLAVTALCLGWHTESRRRLLEFLRENRGLLAFLLLVVAPLAGYHLFYPLLMEGWQMSFAISTDAPAYAYTIEYLQDHVWTRGSTTTEVLPFGYVGRPLTHYLMATTHTLLPINIYQAYSLSAATVSTLNTLTMGLLVLFMFPGRERTPVLIASALVFGAFGFYFHIYYSHSYLGHYYSLLPLMLTPLFVFLPRRWPQRSSFLALCFLGAITIYSVGLSLICAGILMGMTFFSWLFRRESFTQAVATVAMVAAMVAAANALMYRTEWPFFMGNLSRGYYPGLKSWQNLMIKFGLQVNQIPLEDMKAIIALVGIALLIAVALFAAIRNAGRQPAYLNFLLSMTVLVLLAHFLDKYFFLNKVFTYLVPILFIGPIACLGVHRTWEKNLLALLAAGVSLLFLTTGVRHLDRGYMVMAKARSGYVDQPMIDMKRNLYAAHRPSSCFVVDHLLERQYILRLFFRELAWQPNTVAHVWAEFRINPKKPPERFKAYQYDCLIIGKSDYDPVDYSANAPYKFVETDGFTFYGPKASVVDFGLEWDLISGRPKESLYYRRANEPHAAIRFINNGNNAWLEIGYTLQKDGKVVADAPLQQAVFLANGQPVAASPKGVVRFDCATQCAGRINLIDVTPPEGYSLVVNQIRFGPD